MTSPLTATPVATAQQDIDRRKRQGSYTVPVWMQAQQEANRIAPQIDPVKPPTLTTDQEVWNNRLQNIEDYGDIATQGQAEIQAKIKADKAAADFKRWQDQQALAQKRLSDSYSQFQKDMKTKYPAKDVTYSPGSSPQNAVGGGARTGGIKAGQYVFSDATDKKIADWARQAGWSETDIPQLIGIANGESSRNPLAINDKNSNGSTDYGLVQINTIHRGDAIMNDPRIGGASSFYEGGGWKDPVKNLIVAKSIHDAAGGWGDWVAFTTGNATYRPAYTVAKQNIPAVGAGTTTHSGMSATSTGLRAKVVAKGLTYLGTPYVYAGDDLNNGVDCSGLVHSLYGLFGISVPRVAAILARPQGGSSPRMGNLSSWESQGSIHGTIAGWMTRDTLNRLAPGDLVTFHNGSSGISDEFGHVAIYIGNGKILESPDVGLTVRTRSLRDDELSGSYLRGIHLSLPGDPG